MPRPGNPRGNTPAHTPVPAEIDLMRTAHGIGWHPRGGWCRKFPGDPNRTYFGKVPPGDAVRAMVAEEKRRQGHADAEAKATNLTVREAVNLFLSHLDRELAKGEIKDAQRASYGDELEQFASGVGVSRKLADLCKLSAPDAIFRPLRERAIQRGVFAAEKHVTQVRTFLRWCSNVRRFIPAPFWADAFNPPSEKEKRATTKRERRAKGTATWTPAEAREIVRAARSTDVHTYAQVLLMLNGGMGQTDLSELDDADVDWARRCIHTDRSKTLVPRVVPLWDETFDAMQASRAARREPARAEWATRFFLTKRGQPLVLETLYPDGKRVKRKDTLKNWFFRLVNCAANAKRNTDAPRLPHLKRHRAGLYTLRSVFATAAMGQPAELVAVIMGHKLPTEIMEYYARGDMRDKLFGVVEHVRLQLWPVPTTQPHT